MSEGCLEALLVMKILSNKSYKVPADTFAWHAERILAFFV